MDIPGFKLHELKGRDRGRWSIRVNGNRRITFEFRDGHAYVLDYEDYHDLWQARQTVDLDAVERMISVPHSRVLLR